MFTETQEEIMRAEGIHRGVLKVKENCAQPHLKYSWKSIVEKYNVWLDVRSRKEFK